MVQHYLILTASLGFKGELQGAQAHMKTAWEILDNVKVNRDLYRDLFISALNVSYCFGFDQEEEGIKHCDQVLQILQVHRFLKMKPEETQAESSNVMR